ncbi:biotin--[acetyl-CoA-carboxylase] ligase [Holzapfeliella sp. He02]|uniref:Biotin--[acetyl-CoA-carboxylase] ligase n=1 Tax=Holzapfeliella saturejae TaxID=3082953 RepID=A0ABU8SHW4_9LACO
MTNSTISKLDFFNWHKTLSHFKLLTFETIDSTNTYAKKYIDETSDITPTIITSTQQTAGYGKQSRAFFSPKGLYTTLILPVKHLKNLNPGLVTIATGLGAVDTLKRYFPHQFFELKWVNDVLTNGKKCGGILVELVQKDSQFFLVIGIGLNIQTPSFPYELAQIATSVTTNTCDLTHFLADLVHHILNRITHQLDNQLILDYKNYSSLLNQFITVKGRKQSYTGIVRDFNTKGGLVLQDPKNLDLTTFYSGDVTKLIK